jgi:glutamate carboxypeptidase
VKDEERPPFPNLEEIAMEKIRNYLQENQAEMLILLERLVNIDSGSYCKKGIDECGELVTEELQALDFEVDIIPETDWGNHVRARRTGKGTKQILLSAHLDTVWPMGTVERRPFKVEGDLAYGPGVGDMKGGIVQMVYALKALHHLGVETLPVSVFLTGDEEVGSVRGRPYIEEEAHRSGWALIMESSIPPGVIVVRRWGVGAFNLTIYGKAAHVMDPNSAGVNACRELALKILALETLSDPIEGVKVSVNVVQGGKARQVTAPDAWANIDVRVRDMAKMQVLEARVRDVGGKPSLPGIRLELKGNMTRPPMEPNASTELFLGLAAEVGSEIGLEVRPGEKAGGSDGCFTSALGIATLDGMGPICHDICSETERIEVSSLIPKTLLIAGIIQRLYREK